MADEHVAVAPSDHKRKLDDLNAEPLDESIDDDTPSNGNQEPLTDAEGAVVNGEGDAADAKRPRFDVNQLASENGQQEKETETEENDDQRLAAEKSAEQEEGLGNADVSIDAGNKEFVMDETDASAVEQEAVENAEESAKVEIQGASESGAAQEGGVSSVELQATPDGQLSRKIEVPSNKVGALIGKAGDTIRSLQYNSGARIQITRDAEADPNSATRPVELIGSLESITKAEKLIKDVIAEADAGGSPALVARGFSNALSAASVEQVQIQVPNEKVAFIIGKGGETIKNLQSRSGARIQVIPQHLPEGDQSKERMVRITGDKRQIEIARDLIKESMIQVPNSALEMQIWHLPHSGSTLLSWCSNRQPLFTLIH